MIDTEALRKKIIDLAIQGKLTQQLPEDGDAEDLYAQIQKEKAKLIKEGKIKKEKPLPNISDEEIPFGIPSNWKWVRLCDIAHGIWAGGDKPDDFTKTIDKERMIPVVANGAKDGGILGYTSKATASKNTITVAGRGTIGFTVYRDYDYCPIVRLIVIEQSGFIEPKYLQMFLKSMPEASVGSSIPQLTVPMIKPKLVPIPPRDEQRRIVKLVEAVFVQIDTIDVIQQQYESDCEILKEKIIDAGICGKLTEQLSADGDAGDLYTQIKKEKATLIKEGKIKKEKPLPDISDEEISFDIPDNWSWVRLGEIVCIYGGKRIPAGRSLTTEDTGHKYIRVSDMKNRTVLTDNLLFVPEDIYPSISRYIINKEDIYITVAGTIGKVGKIPPEINGANLTENADRLVFDNLDQDWLIWCLSASFIQKQIVKLTTQVAQPKLAITRIQNFVIPLPPIEEQRRIAERIMKLNDLIA